MKIKFSFIPLCPLLSAICFSAFAQGTAFTYQGRLQIFPLNNDDKSLNDADLHGVELAAIQGLDRKLEQKETEVTEMKQQNETMEKRLDNLAKVVELLSDKN